MSTDAITMHSMNSLLSQLKTDYPDWKFEPGSQFMWSGSSQTIHYQEDDDPAYLLHETAHATLGHSTYDRDIDLIKMERDAWHIAVNDLAPKYDITIDSRLVQANLDTYRDWLHARSLCPNCSSNGFQQKRSIYSCPACMTKWRVNEARTCGLKRYKI